MRVTCHEAGLASGRRRSHRAIWRGHSTSSSSPITGDEIRAIYSSTYQHRIKLAGVTVRQLGKNIKVKGELMSDTEGR